MSRTIGGARSARTDSTGSPRLSIASRGGRVDRSEIAADHQAHELRLVQARRGPRGRDRAPLAHDGDLVRDREHFFQSMRDEDDRALRAFEPRDDVEQALDFARAQGRRRLVENDQIGLERERLRNLDKLALRGGKIARLRVERDRVLLPEIGQNFARPPPHRRARQAARPAEIGEENVLEHREVRREARLLHDHGDARVERLARAADVSRLAAIEDLAPVATDMTGNDARQRRLASAVRAEQRMGDARPQGEIGADERARLREALRDRARFQKRCRRVCHRLARERGQR